MRSKGLLEIGAAAALAACVGCSPPDFCGDYEPGSRVVDGACLSAKYPNVDALKADCQGKVQVREHFICICTGISGMVWECIQPEASK